jgi:threonine dehydrogenase-like Zn-dependent dehydrogenase
MKASVLVGPETSKVRDVATPLLGKGEVLVRVEACAVCFSEFHTWQGEEGAEYPQRMGHEPSGIIEQVGEEVDTLQAGQHVAVLPTRRGPLTQYVSGAYADYIVAPQERVALMPEGLTFTEALGEPIACLASAAERGEIRLGDRVAIVGCGFMGLALLQLVALRGPGEIIAVDIRQEALENALRFGADQAVFPEEIDPLDKVVGWEQFGQGVDAVFEVSGTQAGLTLAGEMVKVHGALSIVGYHVGEPRTVDVELWNTKAINVVNAHERRNDTLMRCMQAGLDLIAKGKLDIASLVTHTYPLGQVDEAFVAMRDKPQGYIKGVIVPQT